MLTFDEKGLLMPYDIIEISWEDFVLFFVAEMEKAEHRKILLQQFEKYLKEIRKHFQTPFSQWVDGSFITKQKRPGDIDLVTFLPYDLMVKKAKFVEEMRRTSKMRFNIDGFFAPTAKWNHRYFESCENERRRWFQLFGSTRDGEPKGIIKINYSS